MILAPNHFSPWTTSSLAVYLPRKVQFMAKSQLFKNPALKYIYTHGGVFPVRRGHHDEEAFITAQHDPRPRRHDAHVREGGRSRTGKLGEPQARASAGWRSSPARRSCRSRSTAPHSVRSWKRLQLPEGHDPVRRADHLPGHADPDRDQQQQAANEVFDRVRAMYVDLEENGRRDVLKRLREGLPAASPSRSAEIGSR